MLERSCDGLVFVLFHERLRVSRSVKAADFGLGCSFRHFVDGGSIVGDGVVTGRWIVAGWHSLRKV